MMTKDDETLAPAHLAAQQELMRILGTAVKAWAEQHMIRRTFAHSSDMEGTMIGVLATVTTGMVASVAVAAHMDNPAEAMWGALQVLRVITAGMEEHLTGSVEAMISDLKDPAKRREIVSAAFAAAAAVKGKRQ